MTKMRKIYITPTVKTVELGTVQVMLDLSNNLGIGDGGKTGGKEIEVDVRGENSFDKDIWNEEW